MGLGPHERSAYRDFCCRSRRYTVQPGCRILVRSSDARTTCASSSLRRRSAVKVVAKCETALNKGLGSVFWAQDASFEIRSRSLRLMGGRGSKEETDQVASSSPALSPRTKLANVSPESCPKWEPRPEENLVRISSVYDGDTMVALCLLAGDICKVSLRLKGIDCPEMRGRGPAEKEAATCVRDAVRACCLDKICTITPYGVDKYGRLLADVVLPDGGDLAQLLLRHNLARPYAGDTRCPFTSEEISSILRKAKALKSRISETAH